MTAVALLDGEAIRQTFRQWDDGQQSIAAELNESLAALAAFQSHLDAWQQELAGEREELRAAREQLEQERAGIEHNDARHAEVSAQLDTAHEKIATLTSSLLSRTDELRVLDTRRSELAAQLELAKAREKELKTALDDMTLAREQERKQWAKEQQHWRELAEQRLESLQSPPRAEEQPAPAGDIGVHSSTVHCSPDNPVFASVMEQFGKLRQQRAQERPAAKKLR